MELQLHTSSFRCYDCIHEQTVQTEAAQDAVVPDTLPDIGEVIECFGTFMIRSKDLTDGCAVITGTVSASVLYREEDGESVCTLSVAVPVTFETERIQIGEGAQCTVRVNLEAVEARMLNPRKVMVRSELSAEICCFAPDTLSVSDAVDGENEEVYSLVQTTEFSPVVSIREKTFVVSDLLDLPPDAGEVQEVLSSSLCPVLDEAKAVSGRLLCKGVLKGQLLYAAESGELGVVTLAVPFSQLVDCDEELDAPVIWADVMMTAVYLEHKQSGEGSRIELEAHLLLQTVCRTRKELRYLADAYSNSNALLLERGELCLWAVQGQETGKESARLLCEAPDGVDEVLVSTALAGEVTEKENGIVLPVHVHLLYRDQKGHINCVKKRMELAFPCKPSEGGALQVDGLDLTELYAAPSGDGVDVRLNGQIQITRLLEKRISSVDVITQTEESLDLSSQPALVLLRASSQDDLWTIAKANYSTVEEIMRVNALPDEGESWDQYILVPRVR